MRSETILKMPGYYLLIVLLSAINLSVVYYELFSEGAMSLLSRTVAAISDSLILFLPFIFLVRGKWIRVLPVWFVFLTVLEIANLLYFRNFEDCISGISYFSTSGFNRFVFSGAVSSVEPVDIIFVLTTLSVVYISIIIPKRNILLSAQQKTGYIAVTLVFLLMQFSLSVRRTMIFNSVGLKDALIEYVDSFKLRTSWKTYVMDYGFCGYLVRSLGEGFGTKYKLTEEDRQIVAEFIRRDHGSLSPYLDSIFVKNREKNLILIVVESFNSKVLYLPKANMYLPGINALLNDSSVLCFPKVMAQTGHGRSSDGQFMYNTGMFPLRREALVSRYAIADYPSLAKILGHESVEVIGEDRSLWSHALTSKSYGFSKLEDNVIEASTPVGVQDSLIFDRAAEVLDTLPQPFFMQVTTIGMHRPYDRPVSDMAAEQFELTDKRDLCYLEAVKAFDSSLTMFFDDLKRKGIYDRSVIVVVSDHEVMYPSLSEMFTEKIIPVFIINSSAPREKINSDNVYRQIDVFPTILDVMGYTERAYSGFGESMLRENRRTDSCLVDLSEKLIRSRSVFLLRQMDQ